MTIENNAREGSHFREPVSHQTIVGKVGKKGATFFVRMAGKPKSTAFKGAGGLGGTDVLVRGKQSVMDPSEHPETGQPYRRIGLPLYDVPAESLPLIDDRLLKLIKVVVTSENTAIITAGETTHDAGLKLCAQLVKADASDEEIEAIIVALLPEGYNRNSLKELPGWITSAREKYSTSEDGAASQTKAGELVAMTLAAGAELFRDENKDAFISVPSENGLVTHRLMSSGFQDWIRHRKYRDEERAVNANALREATETLRAIALYEGEKREVFTRIGGNRSVIEIDLGHDDGSVIRITKDGWSIEPQAQFRFVRDAGFLPLPKPERNGDLRDLQRLLGLNETHWRLFLAFVINAVKPTGPYIWLAIEGGEGSGKSNLSKLAKMLFDPNKALSMRLPTTEQDLMIQANLYRLLNYDNASGMRADMSDMFCSLSTGGGFGTRRLYTNDELHVMTATRPFIINGISGYATRPDLLERAMPIRLPAIPSGKRLTQEEIDFAFREMHPRLLGALCDVVVTALAHVDTTEPPRDIRMADAVHWIMAAAATSSLGFDSEAIWQEIKWAQEEIAIERISNEPLAQALYAALPTGKWKGNIGELHEKFLALPMRQSLPKTPAHLSKALHRLQLSLAKIDIEVEFTGRSKKGQCVSITISDPSNLPEPKPLEY